MSILGAFTSAAVNSLRGIGPESLLPVDSVAVPAPAEAPVNGLDTVGSTPVAAALLPGLARPLEVALHSLADVAIGNQGAAAARAEGLDQIAGLLAPAGGLPVVTEFADRFTASWQKLAARPGDPEALRAMIGCGQSLAAEVRRLGAGVETVDRDLKAALTDGVTELNRSLAGLHQINRSLITRAAFKESIADLKPQQEALAARVVELTGARSFPREQGAIALFTGDGTALIDRFPARFTLQGTTVVGAGEGGRRVDDGRLGALQRLVEDGSRLVPPRPLSRDPDSEPIRRLRTGLDAVAHFLTGPAAPGAPPSVAQAYARAPAAADESDRPLFGGGNRLSLEFDPALDGGGLSPKRAALAEVASALAGGDAKRPGLAAISRAVVAHWVPAGRDANLHADAAAATRTLFERQIKAGTGPDLPGEMASLQALQTASAAAQRLNRAAADLAAALNDPSA